MANAYTGDVDIAIGGKPCKIRFDYAAVSELKSVHDKDILKTLFTDPEPEKVASILHIGLRRHNPEITLEEIMTESPPLYPIMQKIDTALAYAYFGTEGAREAQSNPQDIKKKTITKEKKMKWWRRSSSPANQA